MLVVAVLSIDILKEKQLIKSKTSFDYSTVLLLDLFYIYYYYNTSIMSTTLLRVVLSLALPYSLETITTFLALVVAYSLEIRLLRLA